MLNWGLRAKNLKFRKLGNLHVFIHFPHTHLNPPPPIANMGEGGKPTQPLRPLLQPPQPLLHNHIQPICFSSAGDS